MFSIKNEAVKIEMETQKAGKIKISIVTLYDNYLVDPRLKTGWGFSCLVKAGNKNILFDTGADFEILFYNVERMGIDIKRVDSVFLSHVHEDHTGGLKGILEKNGNLTVYIPDSFPDSIRELIKSSGGKYINVKGPVKISEGIFSTGELGDLIKEQSLILNSERGLIIITGCAHPGILSIIEKAKEMFPKEKIYLVLGGFHLTGASDYRLNSIIDKFEELGVQKVAPCHCSGSRCRELFKKEYKENFIENGVGKIIEV